MYKRIVLPAQWKRCSELSAHAGITRYWCAIIRRASSEKPMKKREHTYTHTQTTGGGGGMFETIEKTMKLKENTHPRPNHKGGEGECVKPLKNQ